MFEKIHLLLFNSCFVITAYAQLYKGDVEFKKNEFKKALSFYTEGIDVKCKDDRLNAMLYFSRSNMHRRLGEFTRLFIFRLVSYNN